MGSLGFCNSQQLCIYWLYHLEKGQPTYGMYIKIVLSSIAYYMFKNVMYLSDLLHAFTLESTSVNPVLDSFCKILSWQLASSKLIILHSSPASDVTQMSDKVCPYVWVTSSHILSLPAGQLQSYHQFTRGEDYTLHSLNKKIIFCCSR